MRSFRSFAIAAASAVASVSAAPAQGYFDWCGAEFDPDELWDSMISGPAADPDGDGVPNLHEYVFVGAPKIADTGISPVLELIDDTLALTYRERRGLATSGVRVNLEVSDTLHHWITPNTLIEADREAFTEEGFDLVTLLDPLPPVAGANPRRFLRLRVDASAPSSALKAPTLVAIKPASPTLYEIAWNDWNRDESGHRIERQSRLSQTWETVGASSSDTIVWQHNGADYRDGFTYRVAALRTSDGALAYSAAASLADQDGDGIPDIFELGANYSGAFGTYSTSPDSFSSGGSGVSDRWLIENGFDPLAFDPAADTDGDGINDRDEYLAQQDPRDPHPGWTVLLLPENLVPLEASAFGHALLRDDTRYWRWSAGQLVPLGAWHDPDAGTGGMRRITNGWMSARGDVVLSDTIEDTNPPTGVELYAHISATYTVYPADGTPAWSYTAPHVTTTSDWTDGSVWVESGTPPEPVFVRWWKQRRTANELISPTFDPDGALWAMCPAGVVATNDFENFGRQVHYEREDYALVRITAASGAQTMRDHVNQFCGLRPGEPAQPFGQAALAAGADPFWFVSAATVNYEPVAFSQDGRLLGRSEAGDFFVREQNGLVGELPPGGYGYFWDEQGRINNFDWDWQLPGFRHYLVTPTGPAGAWREVPHVPLPLPEGWVSSHQVAIGGRATQLGMVSVDGAEPRPFIALPTPARLLVDLNRDGVIAPDPTWEDDLTLPSNPFRFWSNDDIDRDHTFYDSNPDTMGEESETEEDDIGPAEASRMNWQPDYLDGRIESKRDLEDFARLWIHTQGLNDAFRKGDLRLGLKWTDTGGTSPSIQLYKSVEQDGGLGYLTDETIAANQLLHAKNAISLAQASTGHGAKLIAGSETFVFPTSLFANLSETQAKTFLLFEGCTPGKGQLKLVILKLAAGATFTEIGEGPGVWMDIKKIGDMYEHWSVGHGNGGPPDSIAARIPSLTGSGTVFRYDTPTPSPEDRKYILYVHGWNMDPWEKERFAETAYKRLWWQGYKGRFGLFSWPATYGFGGSQSTWASVRAGTSLYGGITDGTHFDRGEWTAWRSGAPLRQLLQTLTGAYDGELYVFSHSMGGIVVSEALRLQSQAGGGQIIKTYVPSQAALSAHTYDATLSTVAGAPDALQWTYNHPAIPNGDANYGPQTPNVYGGWHASLLSDGGGTSKAVGQIKNFYNRNDWALSAPVWQFNQITKPDWPDPTKQPNLYVHQGGPDVALTEARFGIQFDPNDDEHIIPLNLGSPENVRNRYEIMAFAAESRVKAFGATNNLSQGITSGVDLQAIWGPDPRSQGHRTHRWHSGQFRNYIQYQRTYWEALLDQNGFNIPFTRLQ